MSGSVTLSPTTGPLVGEEEEGFPHVWSEEACLAFQRATGLLRVPALNRGLNAALMVEAPVLVERWMEGMIETVTTHPVLGSRTLQLVPGPDGMCRLRLDADLLRFILFNELPSPTATATETGEGEV